MDHKQTRLFSPSHSSLPSFPAGTVRQSLTLQPSSHPHVVAAGSSLRCHHRHRPPLIVPPPTPPLPIDHRLTKGVVGLFATAALASTLQLEMGKISVTFNLNP